MDAVVVKDALTAQVLGYVAGHAPRAWAVGGFVRDMLLGRSSHDVDLVVPAGGSELARRLARAFDGDFFVLDRERDVARVILHPAGQPSLTVDVARLREPDVLVDLGYRDFTINAMAVELSGELLAGPLPVIDPFGGRGDLARRLVRSVSEGAFHDDPLRMLRAVRLAVELGFRIQEATVTLIRRDAGLLRATSVERVRDELVRIIPVPEGWQHVRLLQRLGLLAVSLPEAAALAGVAQSPPHYLDVFDHTRSVMAHAEGILALIWPDSGFGRPAPQPDDSADPQAGDPVAMANGPAWSELETAIHPFRDDLRAHLERPLAAGRTRRDWFLWGALAHDWGKAATAAAGEDGRIHFYRHEQASGQLVAERLRALACAADEVSYVAGLVTLHMRPGFLSDHFPPRPRALYRFYRDAGDSGPDVALLSVADKLATMAVHVDPERRDRMVGTAELVFQAYFREHARRVDPTPLLDGRAIMAELGLEPGPTVGKLIADLRQAQALDQVRTREEARTWLRRRLREIRKGSADAQR